MLTATQVWNALKRLGTTGKTVEDVDAVLIDVDQQALFNEQRTKYSIALWDRISPINGVPAQQVLSYRTDIPAEGEVYLIYVDGSLTFFQPHNPFLEGFVPMATGTGLTIGGQFIDGLAWQQADELTIQRVISMLA